MRFSYAQEGANLRFLNHLNRMVLGRARVMSRPLVVAGVAVLSLAPLAGATSASAAAGARPTTVTFFGGVATFRVGGHTWSIELVAFRGFALIEASANHELDTWTFPSEPASDLTVNSKTGNATLDTHSALAPVAFIKLKFKATSRVKDACRSGSGTTFHGKVTGSFTLVANHKGLRFKSAHVTFRAPSVDIEHGCTVRTGPTPCFAGFWNIGGAVTATGNTSVVPGRRGFTASLSRTTTLKAPKNASVTDDIFGTAKKPVFDSKSRTLRVTASAVVTGSAVITATAPPTVKTLRCTLNGKRYTARDTSYIGSFASPKGGQIQARSIVAGPLKVATSGFGIFDIVTLKRA
jgi:hypothetical protein